MCTVSWLHAETTYHLLCNRDEKKRRQVAAPPRYSVEQDVGILAPRDPQGGGTWIALNSRGVSIALLNGTLLNGISKEPEAAQSRGLLPAQLIRHGSLQAILGTLENLDLAFFLPFHLVMAAPAQPTHVFVWDGLGRRLETRPAACGFVTSSSYDWHGANQSRRSLFDVLTPDSTESLAEFHRHHGDGANALSPCMHRDDAETVSFTRIRVDDSSASLTYAPGPPCRHRPGFRLEIPRS
jgi:uncharacterized protein with NRDE domain